MKLIHLFSPLYVVGGGSASKEQSKKRAENKEFPNIEIMAFSPERR